MKSLYSVEITDSTSFDLDDIVVYLIEVLAAPQSARALINDFDGLVAELEQTPFIYPFIRNGDRTAMGYH